MTVVFQKGVAKGIMIKRAVWRHGKGLNKAFGGLYLRMMMSFLFFFFVFFHDG